MKLLKEILYKTNIIQIEGDTNLAIDSVYFDSRKVSKDSLFIAVKGNQVDGHNYIEKAIKNGALAIVCEQFPLKNNNNVTYIKVSNSLKSLGIIAANFFNNPSEKLKLIGVTGTNGKTTCATLLYKLFTGLGEVVGLISTVEIKIGRKHLSTSHTTPDALTLNKILFKMVNSACKYCFMEVSSHGLTQHRVFGLKFDIAVFTNLSHDHLDYHPTFNDYILAKKILFDTLSPKSKALVNKDDKQGLNMLYHTKASTYTYSLQSNADFKCKILENSFNGLHLNLAGYDFYSKLIGKFNAYNLLTIYSVASFLYDDTDQLLTTLSALDSVKGRFQHFSSKNGIIAIVDYAHTPDALKNVLQTIKQIHEGKGNIITVIGCGGDRDKEKRPLMAAEAVKHSDKVIFTSDNPRYEHPHGIVKEMSVGVDSSEKKKVLIITDRKEAIKTAISIAKSEDVILVAGKGHEKYQEEKGEKIPFDDTEVINETFKTIL